MIDDGSFLIEPNAGECSEEEDGSKDKSKKGSRDAITWRWISIMSSQVSFKMLWFWGRQQFKCVYLEGLLAQCETEENSENN